MNRYFQSSYNSYIYAFERRDFGLCKSHMPCGTLVQTGHQVPGYSCL